MEWMAFILPLVGRSLFPQRPYARGFMPLPVAPTTHILKFGGAALADAQGVLRVAQILAEQRHAQPQRRHVVVISALKGVTDLLQEAAIEASEGFMDPAPVRIRHRAMLQALGQPSDLLDRYWREWTQFLEGLCDLGSVTAAQMDFALSFGERLSVRILARACADLGLPSVPVDAWDLGLVSDSRHGAARPLESSLAALRKGLEHVQGIPIVTGFLAKDPSGNLTTLGRNGSDLTASWIASALGAEEIHYWKAVGGIMTADPKWVHEARTLDEVTYGEAAEFAFHGAQVLHPQAIMPSLRNTTRVFVRNVRQPSLRGTELVTEHSGGSPGLLGIAVQRDVLHVVLNVPEPHLRGPRVAEMFEALGACGVEAGLLDAQGEEVSAFVRSGPGVPAALDQLGAGASVEGGLSAVALIGQGVGENLALGRQALEALDSSGVRVRRAFLGSRRSSQAFAVQAQDLATASAVLHGLVLDPLSQGRV